MSKNSAFDIPAKQFDFETDLKYGMEGESLVSDFLSTISGGSLEVKSDRYRNGRMVIETDQNPKGATDEIGRKIWVKSGINVTTAKWWVYIYSPEGAFVMVDVARVKRYLRANKELFNEQTKRAFGGSDNPARGFLLEKEHVFDMLINPKYDEADGGNNA